MGGFPRPQLRALLNLSCHLPIFLPVVELEVETRFGVYDVLDNRRPESVVVYSSCPEGQIAVIVHLTRNSP